MIDRFFVKSQTFNCLFRITLYIYMRFEVREYTIKTSFISESALEHLSELLLSTGDQELVFRSRFKPEWCVTEEPGCQGDALCAPCTEPSRVQRPPSVWRAE